MSNSPTVKCRDENVSRRIRPALWLAVVAALSLCVFLKTSSLQDQTGKSTPAAGTTSPPDALPNPSQPATQNAAKSETTRRPSATDERAARLLACRVANAKAKELYGREPFDDQPALRPEQTGWSWTCRRTHGIADFEATVQLAADGSVISTEVLRLINLNRNP